MNTEKFQGMASEYSEYRPTYPEQLYRFLYEELNISVQSVIADIGAGTGKFSLPLLQKGSNVYCVEPNMDMKLKMDDNLGSFENYHGICAAAENTTLMSSSVDYLVCAQAFHWFDRLLIKKECERILKPKGLVALVWNTRDESDEFNQKHYRINKKYCPEFKGFSGGMNKNDPSQFGVFFKDCPCNNKIFENNLFYRSSGAFIGKCLTGSYAPKNSTSNFKDYVEALIELYEQYSDENGLEVKNAAIIYWGRV